VKTIWRFLKGIWPWLRWCVLALVVVGFLATGLLIYILLFATPDPTFRRTAWPPPDARIQDTEPLFEWPETGDHEYLFEIHQAGPPGVPLYTARSNHARVRLPFGTLQPDRSYHWRVFPLTGMGDIHLEPLCDRPFRTAQRAELKTFWKKLRVFPARLEVTPREMLGRLSLEVDYHGAWRVSLPDALVFFDGEKHLSGNGPAVVKFYFDQGRAAADAGRWQPIRIWAGGRSHTVPLIPGTRPRTAFHEGVDTGFSPYDDTPSFANFERSLLSKLTQGTCVGIALVVKLFFERVDFGEQGAGIEGDFLTATKLLNGVLTSSRIAVRSSTSFRDLSDKQSDLVMGLMSSLHSENLNPQHLRETLRAVFGGDNQGRTEELLWEILATGKLPLVAGFRVRRKVFKLRDTLGRLSVLDSGHAFIVYRGWRYGDATAFAVYDPNYEYNIGHPRRTTLVFYKDGRTAYFVGDEPQPGLVSFMPLEPGQLFTFFALLGHGMRRNLSEVREIMGDLSRGRP
jgi:hypothetical protein